jgi:hypothetical protein
VPLPHAPHTICTQRHTPDTSCPVPTCPPRADDPGCLPLEMSHGEAAPQNCHPTAAPRPVIASRCSLCPLFHTGVAQDQSNQEPRDRTHCLPPECSHVKAASPPPCASTHCAAVNSSCHSVTPHSYIDGPNQGPVGRSPLESPTVTVCSYARCFRGRNAPPQVHPALISPGSSPRVCRLRSGPTLTPASSPAG